MHIKGLHSCDQKTKFSCKCHRNIICNFLQIIWGEIKWMCRINFRLILCPWNWVCSLPAINRTYPSTHVHMHNHNTHNHNKPYVLICVITLGTFILWHHRRCAHLDRKRNGHLPLCNHWSMISSLYPTFWQALKGIFGWTLHRPISQSNPSW